MSVKRFCAAMASAGVVLALLALPAAGQSTGASSRILSTLTAGVAWPVPAEAHGIPDVDAVMPGLVQARGLQRVTRPRLPVTPVAPLVTAPQQQASGGFPWLEVGIGAGVAALFVSAVLTANSGDAAALPSGGLRVVLPGS
jgi:hypothetical protein